MFYVSDARGSSTNPSEGSSATTQVSNSEPSNRHGAKEANLSSDEEIANAIVADFAVYELPLQMPSVSLSGKLSTSFCSVLSYR